MSFGALLIAIFLIFVNGFFVAVEFAFTASRRERLEERQEQGSRIAGMALASMNELPVTFAGAQLGVAAASLALGFVMEPALGGLFEDLFHSAGLPTGVALTLGVVLALLITAFFHNVIGEMAPKNATITAPERAALLLAAPFRIYVTIFRPIIVALTWVAVGILRIFGVNPRQALETTHSASDIASMVKTIGADGIIEASSSRLLSAAIAFRNASVSEVMAPRPDLVARPNSATPEEFEETIVATGHSRIPVFGDDLDDIRGFVHAKDLLSVSESDHTSPLSETMLREVLIVPETMSVAPVMEMMKEYRTHLAIAVDEHGSTAGMVTLEDIAEELVGEIRDEHDIREVMEVRPAGRDRYLVAGQARIERLQDIDVRIPDGSYETLGGYVMFELGRIPNRGDSVVGDGYSLTVRRMDGRRVREIELRVIPPADPAEPG